ncbi:Intracellular exo-alpha-L-arabinofuranosidase 2 [compost metagenome]
MANIAQVVNVLQAVILTEGADMLLTPTYHVFDMYKVHQDASHIAVEADSPSYVMDGKQINQLSASASLNAENQLHISLCNLHHAESLEVQCDIKGHLGGTISGLVITSDTMYAHNTFEEPDSVKSQPFTDYRIENEVLLVTLPARSVVTLCLT